MNALRPLGHRLVIRPDRPVTQTESGIMIPDIYQDTPAMSGVVLAYGQAEGDTNPNSQPRIVRVRARAIRDCIDIVREFDQQFNSPAVTQCILDEMGRFIQQVPVAEHVAQIGQRVIFPMEAGHEIVLGENTDEAVVIVSEDSILAVYEAEEVAA